MATFKDEFKELARELVLDEFLDFADDAVIAKKGGFDRETQEVIQGESQTIKMIEIEYSSYQFNNENIKSGDTMLIGVYDSLSFEPESDNCTVSYDGIDYSINRVEGDPADATITLHCTPL